MLDSATHSLTISPASATKLVFQQVPSTGTINQTLGSIAVAIEDQYGNIVTGNGSTVTIGVASGPVQFSTGSTTSVAAVNGIATFKNLVLGTAGSYTLRVTDGSLTVATSTAISITAGLAAQQNVAITALSSTTAQLTWSAVTGAQGYRIYQVSGTQSLLLGSLSASATSVQINGMSAGFSYSFFVEAFNSSMVADSKTVSVTMPSVQLSAPVVSGRKRSNPFGVVHSTDMESRRWCTGISSLLFGRTSSLLVGYSIGKRDHRNDQRLVELANLSIPG